MFQLPTNYLDLYQEFKFWSTATGVVVCLYKAYDWIKNIREVDLKNVQNGVEMISTKLDEQTKSFTTAQLDLKSAIVNELRELRQDVRFNKINVS